ncbi:hypothetical protein [Indibacter alkaliphilus]|uniref:hypothetical protein n=1 Tax=Indibacter alkaliphilus TaxID=579922 RepID=UPI0002821F25|nr:hypothetical protein [Indibacter alkaliphilus]
MGVHRLFFLLFFVILSSCSQREKENTPPNNLELVTFTRLLDYDLGNLENEIKNLGDILQGYFEKKDSILAVADRGRYKFQGGIANAIPNEDPNLSTIYISSKAQNMDEVMDLLYLTNPIDHHFKELFEKYEVLSQVYFNSKLQINRLYPPYDANTMLEPDLHIPSFNFYYEADLDYNPEKKTVWVKDIYIDPVGKGWVASLIHPVYVEEDLKMVLGFDITVNDLIEFYLNNTSRNLVIIDGAGTVVAGKSKGIEALSLPPLKNFTYNQTIKADNFRMEDFNLFRSKSKEVRKLASKVILSGEESFFLKDGQESVAISVVKMDRMDWFVLDIVFE